MLSLSQKVILAEGWTRRLIAFFGGAIGVLALAPFSFFPAFFVPMTLAVWLIDGSSGESLWASLRRAAGAGWWLGFGYFVAGLWWLGVAFLTDADRFAWALPLGVVGLPAGLAIFTGLGFALARLLWSPGAARIFALAAGLSAAEWIRGHVLTGFPWNDFGMALGANPVFAQFASVGGLYSLTVLSVLLFSTPALFGAGKSSRRVLVVSLAAFLALALFGAVRLQDKTDSVKGVKLRVIQANVANDEFRVDRKAELLERYLKLSDRSTSPQTTGLSDVTHVFWSESVFPFLLSRDPASLSTIASRMQNAILFAGAARAESAGGHTKYFNSLAVIQRGEIKEYFDKMHLTPFGEYMPFANVLARVGLTQFAWSPGAFDAGQYSRVLTAPGLPAVFPLICYESIFPEEVAERLSDLNARPGMMLNVTNDGWFGVTTGPYQHLSQARLRAIEQGLPMARAANTGVSAIIDPYGRLVASTSLGVEAVLDGSLPKALPATFYSQHWRLAPAVAWLIVLVGALIRPRKI
ncbi:apolipoprotein N-acyltransferase [Rhodoblastus sphagnicola]|uniref:Apolipoprotein N-acyltransferase n=1 Tax=Rhodoblastus sphagnicola TaxID=333368 RepID=A0A2S6MUE5_9HYPH|nr:apolipoprotein N-acyltransferase [Rhodoblastus sphagnicola]MBB4197018.1 apolipoprotein N-acyltransferase [Rhodoblastus sphagnicola]PPQ25978.1 apolipoprotein N-acyltransferase [Rhodoblastus sphagnicola]